MTHLGSNAFCHDIASKQMSCIKFYFSQRNVNGKVEVLRLDASLHQPFQNQNPRRFDFRFSTFKYCLFSFLFRATSILYSSQRQPRHADDGATWFPTRPILPSTRTWTDEIRRPRHGYGHGHGWRAYVSRRKWITGGGCGGGVGGYSGQVRRSGLQLRVG